MREAVKAMQERLAIFERHTTATVETLLLVRARTSRVLAATSAFTALKQEACSLRKVVGTLLTLARASDESVDPAYIEGELTRLHDELYALQRKFAGELVTAADSERPPPLVALRPWWRIW